MVSSADVSAHGHREPDVALPVLLVVDADVVVGTVFSRLAGAVVYAGNVTFDRLMVRDLFLADGVDLGGLHRIGQRENGITNRF